MYQILNDYPVLFLPFSKTKWSEGLELGEKAFSVEFSFVLRDIVNPYKNWKKATRAIMQIPNIWPELVPYPKTMTLKIKLVLFCKMPTKFPRPEA